MVEMYVRAPVCTVGTQTSIGYLSIYQSFINVGITHSSADLICGREGRVVLRHVKARDTFVCVYPVIFPSNIDTVSFVSGRTLTFHCSSDHHRLSGMSLKSGKRKRERKRQS